jgi:hypothetical protein
MANRGGARPNSGRKPKADELKLIESLSAYDELAKNALLKGVEEGQFNYIKLFLEYRYGKPKQQVDITSMDESIQRLLIVPENIATKLISDIKEDDLDESSEKDSGFKKQD